MDNKIVFLLALIPFLFLLVSAGPPNKSSHPQGGVPAMEKTVREEIEKLENELAKEHKEQREEQRLLNMATEKRKREEAMAQEGVVEETFIIGPFTTGVSGKPKIPEGVFGVLYWGDWKVLDADSKKEVPRGRFFLHHIFIYERIGKKNFFVTGSSDERVTWGPNFAIGDDAIHLGNSNNTWSMNGVLADINFLGPLKQKKILIQYTVRYWKGDYIPKTAKRALGVSFTSTPKHSLPKMMPMKQQPMGTVMDHEQQFQQQQQKEQEQREREEQEMAQTPEEKEMQLQLEQEKEQQQQHEQEQKIQENLQHEKQELDEQKEKLDEFQEKEKIEQEESSNGLKMEEVQMASDFGLVVSKAHVHLEGPQGSLATLVYATGHLHVGGWSLVINEGKTENELCFSRAIHSVEDKCYIECPKCPTFKGKYPALDTMTYCEEGKKKFLIGNGFQILPYYDGRCGFSGLHGSVFAWYVPDNQKWFDSF